MPAPKPRLIGDELLTDLAERFGTPLYVHVTDGIQHQVNSLRGFDVVRYAMKANPCLAVLERVRAAGAHVDCVSEGELARALAVGWSPGEITFTSDLFDHGALDAAIRAGVHVNLGSPDMIEQYAERAPGGSVTLRVNPGFGHGHNRKVNTGGSSSKHGIWHADLSQCVERAARAGVTIAGLHMHIGSGSDLEHLRKVADAMVESVRAVGASVRTISAGGGLPTPYRPEDSPLDPAPLAAVWNEARAVAEGLVGHALTLEVEPGRFIVAEGGLMLAEVRGTKLVDHMPYVLLNAGFHNLARPMLYGAFHQISVLGRDESPLRPTVVAGPLCEASDVFTQGEYGEPKPQNLPHMSPGDLVCFHDTGAYGSSMASGYNSMAIAAEVVITEGVARLARPRREPGTAIEEELALLHPQDAAATTTGKRP